MKVVVLNDGETFSDIKGCKLLEILGKDGISEPPGDIDYDDVVKNFDDEEVQSDNNVTVKVLATF